MNYCKITEYNDHEGEFWNFWIPQTASQYYIFCLGEYLKENSKLNAIFKIDTTSVPENYVDILVAYSRCGYYYHDSKLGLIRPNWQEILDAEEDPFEFLYKTGIKNLFHPPPE